VQKCKKAYNDNLESDLVEISRSVQELRDSIETERYQRESNTETSVEKVSSELERLSDQIALE
jgi:hypothetical protein